MNISEDDAKVLGVLRMVEHHQITDYTGPHATERIVAETLNMSRRKTWLILDGLRRGGLVVLNVSSREATYCTTRQGRSSLEYWRKR